ncbi:hypothetical protein [Thermococcus sp.]
MKQAAVVAWLGLLLVFLSASAVMAQQLGSSGSSIESVNPSCYIHKADYGQDAVTVVKDGHAVVLAGIYAQVRAEFVTAPCTTDPHRLWSAEDAGDVPGAMFSVYDFQVVSEDWRGASVDAYGAGLGRTWHAHAEVSLG